MTVRHVFDPVGDGKECACGEDEKANIHIRPNPKHAEEVLDSNATTIVAQPVRDHSGRGELWIEPCPCGRCNKFVVRPLFFSQDTSLDKAVAEEVVARYNRAPKITRELEKLVDAWESVPGGRQVPVREIESWLKVSMKPRIDAIRRLLKRRIPRVKP